MSNSFLKLVFACSVMLIVLTPCSGSAEFFIDEGDGKTPLIRVVPPLEDFGGGGDCVQDGVADCLDRVNSDIDTCGVLCKYFACLGFNMCIEIAMDNYQDCLTMVAIDCAV